MLAKGDAFALDHQPGERTRNVEDTRYSLCYCFVAVATPVTDPLLFGADDAARTLNNDLNSRTSGHDKPSLISVQKLTP
jgi:hypothetical protein